MKYDQNDLAYRRGLGKCEFLHKIDDSDEYYDDTDDYRFLELGIELDRNNNNHKITTQNENENSDKNSDKNNGKNSDKTNTQDSYDNTVTTEDSS